MHEIKNFINSQQQQAKPIKELETRKAAAKRSREDIHKLNLEQWTSLKDSVKTETIKWKNSLQGTNGATLAPTGSWTNLDCQGKLKKWNNQSGFKTEENFLNLSTDKNSTSC